MSDCGTCLPLDCDQLVDDDSRLYSLQRVLYPFVINCPSGQNCGNSFSLTMQCCNTALTASFQTDSTTEARAKIIRQLVNQCVLLNAGCGQSNIDITIPPQNPQTLGPTAPPSVQMVLYYNHRTVRTYECPNGAVFTFTVPAGTFAAPTQAQADYQASSYAELSVSAAQAFCPSQNWPANGLCKDNPAYLPITSTNGTSPINWSVTDGALPTGLSLVPDTGRTIAVKGTPTVAGAFAFTLTATDKYDNSFDYDLSLTVLDTFTLTMTSTPSTGTDGTATATPSVAGTYTYLWSPGGQTTQTATGLAAADYTCHVVDTDTGCYRNGTVTVAGGGCFPVTDVTIYTGGALDPAVGQWTAAGGTLSQFGNDVHADGSITLLAIDGYSPSPGLSLDGTFDLTPIGGCLTVLYFNYVTFNSADSFGSVPNLTNLVVNFNPVVASFTMGTNFPACVDVEFVQCDSLASVSVSGNAQLASLQLPQVVTPTLTTLDVTGCTGLTNVVATGCALDQTSVDNLLVRLDNSGLSNGTVNISGGTSATPSGAGATAAANLVGKSWTVTTN